MAQYEQIRDATALERGDIFFFYRPRVAPLGDAPQIQGLIDVARTHVVLHPRDKGLYRLIVLPRKRLPDVTRHEREWAFVEKVAREAGEVERELETQVYKTKTRGARLLPSARPAGEGVYALVRHEDHTHIAYALELPDELGPVQRTLHIRREASYIVSVKNPQAPAPPEASLPAEAVARYPQALEERFQGRRFVPADPPELLDYPGAQLLFIGASADVPHELGIDLDPEHEDARTAEIFRDLHIAASRFPVDPLFKGKWK
jgi:hypothetical protein